MIFTLDSIDKNTCLCNQCFKEENLLTEVKLNPDDIQFFIKPNCKHKDSKGFRLIRYDFENKKWYTTPSLKVNKNKPILKKCRICKEYITINEIENNKNNNFNTYIINKQHYHINCYNNIETTFKKCKRTKITFYHKCEKCNKEQITIGNIWTCPDCGFNGRNYEHTCPKCGEKTKTKGATYTCKCGYSNYVKGLKHHKCTNPNCGYEEDSSCPVNSWICPKCGHSDLKYDHKCPECNFTCSNNCPVNVWFCPICGWKPNRIINHICPNCGNKETTNATHWVCKECGYSNTGKGSKNYHHICPDCGNEDDNHSSFWKCPNCGWIEIPFKHKCPNCLFEEETNSYSWICPNCHKYKESSRINYKLYFCSECNKITPHDKNYNTCLICSHEYIWCYRHERWETVDRQYLENKNKIISTFCPSCNSETPHKYNQQTRKLECQVCNGNLVYNFYIDKFVTLENFESIEQNKNQERYYMYILEKKGIDSTIGNIRKYKSLAKRNGLSFESFVNSLVWCPHCERWETPSFNSRPNHWMFWAAETKQWMDDNSEKVNLAKKIIVGLDVLLNSSAITGVYGWFINGKISYVGESMDILTRSWNHIMYIFEEPDYWYNVIDYLDKNKIEVKILESVDRNDQKYKNMTSKEFKSQVLKPLELKWIDKLHPDSQKCDGTDHIIPVKEREIKINK